MSEVRSRKACCVFRDVRALYSVRRGRKQREGIISHGQGSSSLGQSAMNIPQPIPYQGSKRNIAPFILSFSPYQTKTLVEPFAGSAAVSVAAACYGRAARFYLNDVNRPLVHLWEAIINHPDRIANEYGTLWNEQAGKERSY